MQAKKIIIASNNKDVYSDIIHPLERFGYKIKVCQNGEEVLATIQKEIPVAIISDLLLSQLNGPELCWLLREKENLTWIPFLILIEKEELEIKLNCFRSGVDDVILCPVSVRELLIRMEVLIKRSQKISNFAKKSLAAFVGDIEEFFLADLIQWLHNHKKTGQLWLSYLYERGSIYFEDGKIKSAISKNKTGENAIFQMLSWQKGRFEFESGKVVFNENITMGTLEILLDYSKQFDEKQTPASKFFTKA